MFQFKIKKDLPYKDIFTRIIIFIVTVSAIVYFLPRDGKFNYQFDINKPWRYGQLMATFNFPIYKDDAVIKREQDSIMREFQPYFTLNKEVEKNAITQFRADYNSKLRGILPSADYARHIERVLQALYQSGIASSEDLTRLETDTTISIKVIEDKEATPRYTAAIFNVKEAYEYLLSADTANYRKELLRQSSLNEYIQPNLIYDAERTETALTETMNNYSWAVGSVQSGQKIVDRGEIIDTRTYNILESLRKESLNRSGSLLEKRLTLGGQIILVSTFILLFMIYLYMFRKDYYKRNQSIALLFSLIIFYSIATALMVSNNFFHVYIIPYAMLPIIISIFLDSRTAFQAHCTTILICSIILRYPFDFVLLQIPAGLVGILSLRELSQRSQLFRSAFFIFLTYAVIFLAYEMVNENDLSKMDESTYIYFIINGIFLLFTYPLLFLLEKLFSFTSNVTLVELSNVNNPLLRRLSELAPGTFQHSMQVANLASEAALQVGAKSQLVRTGALYHDIGKMENPVYFTENQLGGINPHKNLSYEESAHKIIAHVTDGLRLADKNNLPKAIKEFISTHHGRGKTKYFYISWKNEHPGEEPDEDMFTYPGPNPSTKETAILMMADAVEAASRSLPEYTAESISNLVEKIIDSQLQEGFFKNCPITFQDIAVIKEVFKEKLMTSYHTRISYPELQKEETEKKEEVKPEEMSEETQEGMTE